MTPGDEAELAGRIRRSVWRDAELSTAEMLAVVLDPWWRALPRPYRVAWWLRWERLRGAHAAGYDSWDDYLAALENERLLSLAVGVHDQPEAEHRVTDGWPEGFAVPKPIAALRKVIDSSWEVRMAYARGYRKVGQGNVGTSASARWELTHYVLLHVRPVGDRGEAWARVTYAAPAVPGALVWKFEGGRVPGAWKGGALAIKAVLKASAAEAVKGLAKLSGTRQEEEKAVAVTTDIFAAWTLRESTQQQ